MDSPEPRRQWLRLTPDRVIIGLLVLECLLWLPHSLGWPHWHKGCAVLTCIAIVGLATLAMLLWWLVALIVRWPFQYRLRSLVVLVVAVALPCSWLGVEMKKAREQRRTVEAVEKSGIAELDCPVDGILNLIIMEDRTSPKWEFEKCRAGMEKRAALGAIGRLPFAWVRSVLGDDFFMNVGSVALVGPEVTDADLEYVSRLARLRTLSLTGSRITDTGLKHLRELKDLETLTLDDTIVADKGLVHLARLTNLQYFFLARTQVTDAGLECLVGLTQLKQLDLTGTRVSHTGVERLQQILPNCKIIHDTTRQ